jgi:hypothetical protein
MEQGHGWHLPRWHSIRSQLVAPPSQMKAIGEQVRLRVGLGT